MVDVHADDLTVFCLHPLSLLNLHHFRSPPIPTHCFSVFTKARSVNFQARSEEERDWWAQGLQLLLAESKGGRLLS